MNKAKTLHSDSRPLTLREQARAAVKDYFHHLDGQEAVEVYQMVLAEIEAPLIEETLEYTGGNQSKAARVLGLNRGTFRKKMKLYDLE